jgi:hypothetical protein
MDWPQKSAKDHKGCRQDELFWESLNGNICRFLPSIMIFYFFEGVMRRRRSDALPKCQASPIFFAGAIWCKLPQFTSVIREPRPKKKRGRQD